jgi:Chlorophyll A-B binding protein
MFKFALILSALAVASAFTSPRVVARSSLKMSAESLTGSLAPLGFFDPLGLSAGKSDKEMKKIREAELKHGRLAMLAALGMIVGEKFNPLFDGKISGSSYFTFSSFLSYANVITHFNFHTGPAIYQFQQADNLLPTFWVWTLLAVGVVEGQNIISGWGSKDENGMAYLKDEYVNGDLGFDPLGLKPKNQDDFDVMRTKELQNGRLAMIGVAGMVAQELVNQKGILETLGY